MLWHCSGDYRWCMMLKAFRGNETISRCSIKTNFDSIVFYFPGHMSPYISHYVITICSMAINKAAIKLVVCEVWFVGVSIRNQIQNLTQVQHEEKSEYDFFFLLYPFLWIGLDLNHIGICIRVLKYLYVFVLGLRVEWERFWKL